LVTQWKAYLLFYVKTHLADLDFERR
jgi:hypothetical protein